MSVTANAALVTLYWQIGYRVRTEVLEGRRAEYGVQIVATVSRELEARYGRGFNERRSQRSLDLFVAELARKSFTGRLPAPVWKSRH